MIKLGRSLRRKFYSLSVKVLGDICLEHDLLDIWRVRHPKLKRNVLLAIGVKKRQLLSQRRLDFWLISEGLQNDVVSVDIKTIY